MNVRQMARQLALDIVVQADLEREVSGGYASDLLSCVMARAQAGNVWVTLQSHPNVIAVASLLDLCAVIVTEGMAMDEVTRQKAQQASVNVLSTIRDTFTIVGDLARLGIKGTTER
jgi:hypothetical protein